MVVITNDGRQIECDRITCDSNRYLHLYRNSEDGEYEYEMVHSSRVIEISAYKED